MAKTITLTTPGANAHYSQSNISTNFENINNNFANFLHLGGTGESGNSITGDVDWGAKKIINLATPSSSTDAANKAYVDQKALILATGTSIESGLLDADNDTGVDSEVSADLDRLDLFAATSGGAETAIEITGDDTSAAALDNPFILVKKHVILDTDVRIQDVAGTTFIELADTGKADTLLFEAGGNAVLDLAATEALFSQNIALFDNAAQSVGKQIGDEDGDTFIRFNQATGGTDDDTIWLVAGGVAVANWSPSLATLTGAAVDVIFGNNVGIGISALPGASEANAIILAEGTAIAGADMTDAEIMFTGSDAGSAYAGESKLSIDFKSGASAKKTVILGQDCTFPNNVTITNDLLVSGALSITGNITSAVTLSDTTASSSKDTGALIVEGGIGVEKDVFVGGDVEVAGRVRVDGMWHHIETITASASDSLDFTSSFDGDFDYYEIRVNNLLPGTDGANILLRMSDDGGISWESGASSYGHTRTTITYTGATEANDSDEADSKINIALAIGSATNEGLKTAIININRPNVGEFVSLTYSSVSLLASATDFISGWGTGLFIGNTNPINGVQIFPSTGNLASGTASLFGMKIPT